MLLYIYSPSSTLDIIHDTHVAIIPAAVTRSAIESRQPNVARSLFILYIVLDTCISQIL
jgi:hypothetical protein